MSQRRSYLPIVLATIMILLSLGLIGVWWWFVGEYNTLPPAPSPTVNSNTTSNINTASNANTSAVTTPGTIIADAFVNLGKTLVIDSSFTAKNLPADVFAGQVGDAYVADDYAFLIIHERDINTPVLPVDQAVTWAGVLVSNDRGTTWQKWYTIVDPTVDGAKLAHNIVGIFTLDKKMYLDVADARGAGSGEGNMRRIVSSDAGASWADGACYYMSMETYYKPAVADRQSVAVDGLTPGTNCAYTVATATASADATSDWKMYTNSEFGYRILYPKDWRVVESTVTSKNDNVGFGGSVAKGDTIWGVFAFGSKSVDQVIKDIGSQFSDRKETRKIVRFNGITAAEVTVTSKQSSWISIGVVFELTGKVFHVANGASTEPNFEAFYRSFSFTDQTATKDWKTYTNTKHGYSFRYPKDWTLGDSPASSTPGPTADDIAFDGPDYTGDRWGARVVTVSGCSTLQTCTQANRLSFDTDEQTTGLSAATVAGEEALTETITRPTTGNWKYYVHYVLKGGKLYRFFTTALATDDAATKPTFDQILSTVTFTE